MLCFKVTKDYGSYYVPIENIRDTIDCELDLLENWIEGDKLSIQLVDIDDIEFEYGEI